MIEEADIIHIRTGPLGRLTYGQILTRRRHGLLGRAQMEEWEAAFKKVRGRWPDEGKDWTQRIIKQLRGGVRKS
jgi:hypothetical protein